MESSTDFSFCAISTNKMQQKELLAESSKLPLQPIKIHGRKYLFLTYPYTKRQNFVGFSVSAQHNLCAKRQPPRQRAKCQSPCCTELHFCSTPTFNKSAKRWPKGVTPQYYISTKQ